MASGLSSAATTDPPPATTASAANDAERGPMAMRGTDILRTLSTGPITLPNPGLQAPSMLNPADARGGPVQAEPCAGGARIPARPGRGTSRPGFDPVPNRDLIQWERRAIPANRTTGHPADRGIDE